MGREKGMRKNHGNFGKFKTTSLKTFTHGVRLINPGAVVD